MFEHQSFLTLFAIFIILAIEVFIALRMRMRLGALNPAELCCWYILAAQVVYVNGDVFFYTRASWPTYSYLTHPLTGVVLYFAMFLIFASSTIGIRRIQATSLKRSISITANRAMGFSLVAMAACYVILLLQIAVVRHDYLWFNRTYLLLRGPDSISYGGAVGQFVQNFVLLAGFTGGFFFAASLAGKRYVSAVLWFPVALWATIFYVASASRGAFLLVAEIYLILWMIGSYRKWVLSVIFLPLCYVTLSSALNARIEGAFGLSALPDILSNAFTGDATLAAMVENLFEGIFSTADGLDYGAVFSTRYAILSFSPLPGFIDHFPVIRDTDQIRLFSYIPMSAITESVKFGWSFFLLLMGTFWMAARLAAVNAKRLGAVYMVITVGLFARFIGAGAYPVRNVYRTLLILIVVTLVVSYWNSYREKKQGLKVVQPRRRQALRSQLPGR